MRAQCGGLPCSNLQLKRCAMQRPVKEGRAPSYRMVLGRREGYRGTGGTRDRNEWRERRACVSVLTSLSVRLTQTTAGNGLLWLGNAYFLYSLLCSHFPPLAVWLQGVCGAPFLQCCLLARRLVKSVHPHSKDPRIPCILSFDSCVLRAVLEPEPDPPVCFLKIR